MVSADQAPHNPGADADPDPIDTAGEGFPRPTMTDVTGQRAHVRYDTANTTGAAQPSPPEPPSPGSGPVDTGRPVRHRLPEPPPVTMSVCEQTRIERIPLTDVAMGVDGESTEPEYAVVLRTVRPAAAATGPEQIGLSTTDTSGGHGTLTGGGDTGEPGIGYDDTGIVRSVN